MLHSCLSWKRIIFFRVRWMNVLANGSKRKWMFVMISIQCTVIMMGWCIFFDLGTSAQDRSELIAPRFPPIDLMWCLSQPKSVAYAGVVINPLVLGWRILHLRSHKPRTTLWLSWNPSMIVEICWHWTKRSYVICLRKYPGWTPSKWLHLPHECFDETWIGRTGPPSWNDNYRDKNHKGVSSKHAQGPLERTVFFGETVWAWGWWGMGSSQWAWWFRNCPEWVCKRTWCYGRSSVRHGHSFVPGVCQACKISILEEGDWQCI